MVPRDAPLLDTADCDDAKLRPPTTLAPPEELLE